MCIRDRYTCNPIHLSPFPSPCVTHRHNSAGKNVTACENLSELLLRIYKMCIRDRNKGKTITRERLLEQVWDCNGSFVNNNTLTVTIKRLREKLHQPLCLKTVRSFGYRMEDTL